MEWTFKKFDRLELSELYDILTLRSSVFVVEQECPYQDLDKRDYDAMHLLGYIKNDLIAYSRIFPPGVIDKKFARIGRVVTQKENRGKGIGFSLVEKSIKYCRDNFVCKAIKISAQVYLKSFYTRLGFVERGNIYLEDGIPHCAMYFDLK